ncbi:MAG TPA: peptidylprolyl isomerase [Planctomicrobium sp.]|nr:peptidylprolyl isomerase [Planctomicrobium sp.]
MPKHHRHLLLMLAMVSGCAGKSYNVANPVLGPPPPRISSAVREVQEKALAQTAETPSDSKIQLVSASFDAESPLADTAVIARVNGRPLLASDVLEQYGAKMREYEAQLEVAVKQKKLTEAEKGKYLRKAQEMLIRRDLDRMVEQNLLAQAVRSRLKKEQLDDVNKQIDSYFEKDVVESLKIKFEVTSTTELEVLLQDQGTSLETMRRIYSDQQMASQFVRTKIGEEPKPSRAELLAVYRKQIDKYAQPTQVKWQQLQISTGSSRTPEQAEEQIAEALQAIKQGMSFDDAVKKYSDGPLKNSGGHWDWTQPASIAIAEVRKELETLKPGKISKPIKSFTGMQIVKVLERREAGHQPLEEVQEEIRMQIIEEWREGRVKEVMKEVMETAVIETMFDTEDKPEDKKSNETKFR